MLFWKLFTIVFWLIMATVNGWLLYMAYSVDNTLSISISWIMVVLSTFTFLDWINQSHKFNRRWRS